MPTYEYRCSACGAELEVFQSITEGPKRKCPECGARKLERKIGAGAGFLFRGSGFYQTDYRSESYRKAEAGEKNGGSKPAEAQGSGETRGDADATEKPAKAAEKPAKTDVPGPKPKPAGDRKRKKPH